MIPSRAAPQQQRKPPHDDDADLPPSTADASQSRIDYYLRLYRPPHRLHRLDYTLDHQATAGAAGYEATIGGPITLGSVRRMSLTRHLMQCSVLPCRSRGQAGLQGYLLLRTEGGEYSLGRGQGVNVEQHIIDVGSRRTPPRILPWGCNDARLSPVRRRRQGWQGVGADQPLFQFQIPTAIAGRLLSNPAPQ
jgi:hypothetical protein